MNSFGRVLRLTTFGESHGPAVGGILDGCPALLPLSEADVQPELDLRRPGGAGTVSARQEKDRIRFVSGLFEGRTTGAPVAFIIANEDQHSGDYEQLRDVFRPGHGDFSWQAKYGIRDHRGGGRVSGRETVCRVAGGAVALKILRHVGVEIFAFTREIAGLTSTGTDWFRAGERALFAPEDAIIPFWEKELAHVKECGDSVGGIVEIVATSVPAGLGEPVFDKLDARLAAALMSVGAVKGVEVGAGFASARMRGSQHNDQLGTEGFLSNHSGGILADISNGQNIVLRAAVKPIPSIAVCQQTVTCRGERVALEIKGRHDVCAIPRIVPVLKAMAALALADMLLLQQPFSI